MAIHLQQKQASFHYIIHFPVGYNNVPNRLEKIQKENHELEILLHDSHSLAITITETLEGYGYFAVKLPGWQEDYFEDLRELNPEIHFEYANTEEVYIKMGIFAIIGAFTALIAASIVNWARKSKLGKVYSDPTEYELEVEIGQKTQKRIPDLSFISYEKVAKEIQKTWKERIPVSPNLSVEIVSAKKGLKKDLNKMETVWMPSGVELGLVLCPYSEKIYIFEKGKKSYRTQSIFKDFNHPVLPGYTENFGDILKECRE